MTSENCLANGLIVLDWGTTNVRLALLDADGAVVEERRGESGVGSFDLRQFETHFDKLTSGWPRVPAIAAGMVGSRQGWQEAQYLPCPASTSDLALGLHRFTHQGRSITFVPGLKLDNGWRFDVMRGEESQIAGFLTRQPGFSGTLIMPGTHSKWVHIDRSTVINFQTYMTGEVFEALSQHTILRHSLSDSSGGGEHFAIKAQQMANEPSSAEGHLFGLRARQLLEGCDGDRLCDELSAVLIMAELHAGQKDGFTLQKEVVLIGSEGLTERYQIALRGMGVSSRCMRGSGLVWPALFAIAHQSQIEMGKQA